MKKTVKRLMAIFYAASMLLLIASGCTSAGTGTTSEEDLLDAIMRKGKIVVCLNTGNEPWGYMNVENNNIEGMAIDLINGFAESIGVETEIQPYEFSSLIPAIESGKADIICTNLTRTATRATSVLFTEPVGSSIGVAIIRKGEFATIDDLNKEGIISTTEGGTIWEDVSKDVLPNATMSPVTMTSDAIAALKAGRADTFLTDITIATAAVNADDSLEYLPKPIYLDTFAFAVKCDASSYTFIEAFNTYLRLIKLDGTYGELYETYFGEEWVPNTTEVGA